MDERPPIDPLAQQVAQFIVAAYLPRLVRAVRRSISVRSLGWLALAAALVVVPIAIATLMKMTSQRAANKRYDTADYLSDDLS